MEHHAYYVEGDLALMEALAQDIKKRERIPQGSPAFIEQTYEKFGIDESRELQSLAQLKKMGPSSVFLIGISSITTEAQQSLLKLFEEPQEGLTFVLLIPHGILLPTLRSRFLPYPHDIEGPAHSKLEAKKFLAASGKERSNFITLLLKDDEGVKERVRGFLYALELELAPRIAKSSEVREGLQDISKVRSYVADRSPSLKMLLEHLSVALPKL